jgi:uncharacterized protein Yka (UPF0111/DUF47 family)
VPLLTPCVMPLIDRLVKMLLPREDRFFDLLVKGAEIAEQSAHVMKRLCEDADGAERSALVKEMQDVEHAADAVIHEVYDALNRTFVTPIDRSDIYDLATHLEDIVDLNHATAMQLEVHVIGSIPEGSLELASLCVQAGAEVKAAVEKLRGLKHLDQVRAHCTQTSRLEHEGDVIYRGQMKALFRNEQNAVRLIQHKEFLEGLERVLDAFDHTGGSLSAIVIKNG